jgi:hypothetical protein
MAIHIRAAKGLGDSSDDVLTGCTHSNQAQGANGSQAKLESQQERIRTAFNILQYLSRWKIKCRGLT